MLFWLTLGIFLHRRADPWLSQPVCAIPSLGIPTPGQSQSKGSDLTSRFLLPVMPTVPVLIPVEIRPKRTMCWWDSWDLSDGLHFTGQNGIPAAAARDPGMLLREVGSTSCSCSRAWSRKLRIWLSTRGWSCDPRYIGTGVLGPFPRIWVYSLAVVW